MSSTTLIGTVEDIPDGDTVSRLVDFPRMYEEAKGLIWEVIFQFSDGNGESLVWRRYAPSPDDVHCLGCEREAAKRKFKPEMRYAGFISSTTGAIRGIKTSRGHGFSLEHAPEEGRHHAEVCYSPANQDGYNSLKKTDKADLKASLKKVFSDLVSHSCAEILNQ